MSIQIQWLRKYDPVKQKYTNQTMPYSKELALDGNWKMIEPSEKVACDAALAVEKKQAAMSKRMEQAIVNAPMPSKIDKMTDKGEPDFSKLPPSPDDGEEITEDTPEPVDEPLQMALDDLDDMSKAQLQEVIDNEDLPVNKVGNKTVLMAGIREARKAKAAAPVEA